jgi:hypothetical protein
MTKNPARPVSRTVGLVLSVSILPMTGAKELWQFRRCGKSGCRSTRLLSHLPSSHARGVAAREIRRPLDPRLDTSLDAATPQRA